MRGRKVVNTNQLIQYPVQRIEQPKAHLRKRLPDVKSLDQRFRTTQPAINALKPAKPSLSNAVNQYEFQRRTRQTVQCKPVQVLNVQRNFIGPNNQQSSRSQRNTEGLAGIRTRQNYLLGSQNDQSMNSSHHKIKLVSADSKERPSSRSQNSSAKKRGIELTKTLLKRISGMYNDKDFQTRTSFVKSKEETTRMTTSGRGVHDEYQISDFDFQVANNHTFNISASNPLSFNDSGNWNKSSGHYVNNSEQWMMGGNLILSQEDVGRKKEEASREQVVRTPQKLMKVRSYDLINTQTTVDSVVVGDQPPPREQLTRRGQANPNHQQRYLIRSKNKTMDQMSLKQSMVVGFDQYYN